MESQQATTLLQTAEQAIRDFALGREDAVQRGLESRELAGLLTEKFGEGLWRTFDDTSLVRLTDELCLRIDPKYQANRKLRYSKYAKLDLSEDRKE